MENQENNLTNEQPVEKKQEKEVRVSLSTRVLQAACAIIPLTLFLIYMIISNFIGLEPIFLGVMSIFVYIPPFIGIVWGYLTGKALRSFEFWMNVAALYIVIRFM